MVILLASCIRRNDEYSFDWEYSGKWKTESIELMNEDIEPWCLLGWEVQGYVRGIVPGMRKEGQVIAVLDAGFRDDLGWELYDVYDGSMKCSDHGSHVLGTVSYLSPGRLIGIRVTDGEDFNFSVIADGIRLAVDLGATVISMSFGGGLEDPQNCVLYDAIKYSVDRGVLLVAAAGNSGTLVYPAAYEEVIAVGSLSDTGKRSRFSAFGDTWGYGENCSSYLCVGSGVKSGTSMSAPQIAALLGNGYSDSDLWLAGFGVPFNPPGDWYLVNDNGYDYEVVKFVDSVRFKSRIGKVYCFRDDDENGVVSAGDLFGECSIDVFQITSIVGRYL